MEKKTSAIAVFFLLLAAVNLALSLTVARETPLKVQAWKFVSLGRVDHPGDLIPMHQVLQTSRTGKEPIYREHFFKRSLKFIYPPTAMIFFHPFRSLSQDRFLLIFADIVNRLFLLLGIACSLLLFRRLAGLAARTRPQQLALYLSFSLLLITFYPFFKAFTLGQAQVWINSLILFALTALLSGRERVSGAAMALCTLIKPSYGLILLWGLARRRWRFVTAFLLVCLVGLGVSLAVYGWQNHVDYLKVFRLIGQRGEGYYPNQSLNGLLNRALFNGNNIAWSAHRYPPAHPVVIWGSAAFTLLITLFGLWVAVRKRRAPDWLTFAVMMLCISLAAPIAWEHSYGYTFPLLLLAMAWAFAGGKPQIPRLALAASSFLLASHFLHFINLRFHAGHWNFLQSYLFFAELVLLGLLAWHAHQQSISPAEPARTQ